MRQGFVLALGLTLAGLSGAPALANPVQNSNFAANGGVGTSVFAHWVTSDNSVVVDNSFARPGDAFDAAFTGNGTLSQSIPTTAGRPYILSFFLVDEAGLNSDVFTVTFGGFTTSITGDTATTYTPEVFSIPASAITGGSTTLTFQASNPVAVWNLDDASLIPEPPAGVILAAAGLMLLSLRLRKSSTHA